MVRLLVVGTLVMLGCVTFAGIVSDPVFVSAHPERSSFWRTATNATVSVDVSYPRGVSSASLKIVGRGRTWLVADVPEGVCEVRFPVAAKPSEEWVYALSLAFDNGTTNTATVAVVQGCVEGNVGGARCLMPTAGNWSRTDRTAVLPVAYGTTVLTVAGKTVDAGLGGAQGWYALGPLRSGESFVVTQTDGETEQSAEIRYVATGMVVILK